MRPVAEPARSPAILHHEGLAFHRSALDCDDGVQRLPQWSSIGSCQPPEQFFVLFENTLCRIIKICIENAGSFFYLFLDFFHGGRFWGGQCWFLWKIGRNIGTWRKRSEIRSPSRTADVH